ncbi:MAG: ArsR family transcriptional regulator [Candidatus Nitrosotalea sp.]|nr:ArsR family transcriptional regulator [Candidatus Nitrosotalea sp.]
MQIVQQGRILEEKIADEILKIISNDQAMQILQATTDIPKSAWEISTKSRIPLTQVYRWVRRLHNSGLVRISGNTNSSGKKFFMYQSKINSIKVSLNASTEPIIEIS